MCNAIPDGILSFSRLTELYLEFQAVNYAAGSWLVNNRSLASSKVE